MQLLPESKSSEVKIRSQDKGEHMAKKRRLSWAVMIDGRSIWTLNAVPKRSQYGESLRKFRGVESLAAAEMPAIPPPTTAMSNFFANLDCSNFD